MKQLYKIGYHPTTLDLRIVVFDVIDETPKHYDITPVLGHHKQKGNVRIRKEDERYHDDPKKAIAKHLKVKVAEARKAVGLLERAKTDIIETLELMVEDNLV